jgi:polar amino acid transport system substrate-binding protein
VTDLPLAPPPLHRPSRGARPHPHGRRLAVLAAGLLCAATVLTGCGGGDSTGATAGQDLSIDGVGTVKADSALTKQLPAAVRKAKKVTVATNAPYPPFIDFKTEGSTDEFKGLDYDVVQAIAARLGVEAPFTQQPFDGLVPGLKAGKYDAIVGGITDNKERQATATFVDYSASGTGIMVGKGNPEGITTLQDLCGKQVAVQKAAKQATLLRDFSAKSCGGSAVKVTEFPQNTDAVQALVAGKVVAIAATKVNLVDDAEALAGKAEVVDDPAAPNGYQASPNGIGFDKKDGALAKAFQASLQSLMDDGTYDKILAKYGQKSVGIDQATIDQAVD